MSITGQQPVGFCVTLGSERVDSPRHFGFWRNVLADSVRYYYFFRVKVGSVSGLLTGMREVSVRVVRVTPGGGVGGALSDGPDPGQRSVGEKRRRRIGCPQIPGLWTCCTTCKKGTKCCYRRLLKLISHCFQSACTILLKPYHTGKEFVSLIKVRIWLFSRLVRGGRKTRVINFVHSLLFEH